MKDKQKYKKALEDIGCILSDVCNNFYADGYEYGKKDIWDNAYQTGYDDAKFQNDYPAYQRGYEDGKRSYGTEIRTAQDVEEAYKHGLEDGRKANMIDIIKEYEEKLAGNSLCETCVVTDCNTRNTGYVTSCEDYFHSPEYVDKDASMENKDKTADDYMEKLCFIKEGEEYELV